MKFFNAGAQRPATDAARLTAANELVHRTLSQHGLLPSAAQDAATSPIGMPSLGKMLKPFSGSCREAAAGMPAVPDGATFKGDDFTCAAGSRRFRTYVPASASDGASGIVLMLHGCTQTPEDFATGTGMNVLADAHGFIVVYPEQSRGENAQSCWNWFSPGDQRRGRGEPAILSALAQKVGAEHGLGREHTFVAGLSAGAAMAVILGETYPDVFSAVGAHSGLPPGSAKDVASAFAAMAGNALEPASPAPGRDRVRTIVFHGTADSTVHPSNGEAIARRARDMHAPQSIETSTAGHAAGRNYRCEVSSDTEGAALVERWIIEGQGHAWSGGQPAGSYTDLKGPNASAEMIRFFLQTSEKVS